PRRLRGLRLRLQRQRRAPEHALVLVVPVDASVLRVQSTFVAGLARQRPAVRGLREHRGHLHRHRPLLHAGAVHDAAVLSLSLSARADEGTLGRPCRATSALTRSLLELSPSPVTRRSTDATAASSWTRCCSTSRSTSTRGR